MILDIDSDEGILKIGSPPEILPGIVESIKINDALLMENAEVQGRSGTVKIVQGWDDAALTITMSLIDDPKFTFDNVQRGSGKTRWDCLKQITAAFKKVADNGEPEIYTLSHPMINAWGTKRLLFTSLESTESRTRRRVTVTLEFAEYESPSGVIQDRQKQQKKTETEFNEADLARARERMLVSDGQRRELGKMEARFASV